MYALNDGDVKGFNKDENMEVKVYFWLALKASLQGSIGGNRAW